MEQFFSDLGLRWFGKTLNLKKKILIQFQLLIMAMEREIGFEPLFYQVPNHNMCPVQNSIVLSQNNLDKIRREQQHLRKKFL